MLLSIKYCFAPNITHTSYNEWITNQVLNAKLEQITINNKFTRMRHDMNRFARKTWSKTKAIHGLEKHIWLYIAWNNKYKIK